MNKKSLKLPNIKTNPVDGYALHLGDNFDTVQECFCTTIPADLVQRLDDGQKKALERHEGQGTRFMFGGEEFQIWSGGSQGNRWVIENDDMQLHIRTDKAGWNISVRYLAAGLYEYGIDALKNRAVSLIQSECNPIGKDWITLSRLDYAFDFYSPEFSKEMLGMLIQNNLVLTSGVKAGMVFTSKKIETLTIGMNRKGIQIQVYDKGKEIKESSGKFWMKKIWERAGYFPPEGEEFKDVWRVEVRFGKEFLKDRNIKTLEAFREKCCQLITEAVMRRRMVAADGESMDHKERWGLHPMWAAVFDVTGMADEYIPVGRQITMAGDEYIEMLKKQMVGVGRSLSVAQTGHFNERMAAKNGYDCIKMALDDDEHINKVAKTVERLRFVNEAH